MKEMKGDNLGRWMRVVAGVGGRREDVTAFRADTAALD